MIPSELAEKIIRLTWHQTNVIAAATMIEARDERIRREERERCLQAVAGERLRDDARTPEDVAYQHAIDDCLAAIRSLAPEAGADPARALARLFAKILEREIVEQMVECLALGLVKESGGPDQWPLTELGRAALALGEADG